MKDVSSLAERIIDHIADAVIYADRTGTIRRWNQGATALFGYSAAEALDQNLDPRTSADAALARIRSRHGNRRHEAGRSSDPHPCDA
jgi:PAS domain S-box-containing protein